MRRPSLPGAVAAALCATVLVGQGPAVEVTTIDGRVLRGALTAAGDEVRIAPASGAATMLPMSELLTVRAESPQRSPEALFCVWLRSGSVLPAVRIDGAAAESDQPAGVIVETPSGAHVRVPMSTVAAMRTRVNAPATLDADRTAPDDNHDFLYVVKDGEPQRFTVTVHSIHDGLVHFDLRGTAYDFPLRGADSTAAIVFGKNTGFAPDRLPKPRVEVALSGGERCSGQLLSIDATLSLLMDEGARLVVPSDRLQSLDFATDRLAWLSALKPIEVDQTAAFDRTWPWTVDGSPAGPGIRLGGRVYARGLVLVPRTRLTYDLDGRYDLFEATIGIDERGGPQSHAIFRVLGDGVVLFESDPMTLGSAPLELHVELNGARQLAIEADFGKNFDLGDLCAFAEARVVQR